MDEKEIEVTFRKRIEAEILKKKEELELLTSYLRESDKALEGFDYISRHEQTINEMKSRFVSFASHELRTPLSTILSSISLLEKYTEPEHAEKRKKHFDRIKSAIKNLTEILGDFLSLDKLEHGKIDVVIEPFDLCQLSDAVRGTMEEMLKEKQIVITHTHSGSNIAVSDGKIIKHILSNLLSNAIKYSHKNGEINLATEINNDHLIITIKDNGIGIPEEDQKDLFTMFHRAKNVDNIQGTGLGLNIVKRYLEVLEGTITFNSKINAGATFRIEIPQAQI